MNAPATASPRVLRRSTLGAGLVVLVVLAVTTWHTTRPLGWERPVISAVGHLPFPTRDFWIAMFEPVPFALTTAALACAAAARRRGRLAVSGFAGCAVATLVAELVLKPLVDRVRMIPVDPARHHLMQFGGRMFPSAHVTAAAALATFGLMLVGHRSRLVPLLLALPLVIGVATMSKQMHDPADVLAGLILGPTVVYLVVSFARARRVRPAPDVVASGEPV